MLCIVALHLSQGHHHSVFSSNQKLDQLALTPSLVRCLTCCVGDNRKTDLSLTLRSRVHRNLWLVQSHSVSLVKSPILHSPYIESSDPASQVNLQLKHSDALIISVLSLYTQSFKVLYVMAQHHITLPSCQRLLHNLVQQTQTV